MSISTESPSSISIAHSWSSSSKSLALPSSLTRSRMLEKNMVPPSLTSSVSFWKNGYNWRKHEAELNAELPQSTRDITVDGFGTLNIHYVHKRSAVETGKLHGSAQDPAPPCCAAPPSHKHPLLLISHLLSYISFLGYTEREKAGLNRSLKFLTTGSGCFATQSTCPQTLGYGLTDSPVGLLAWIYEKLAASVAEGEPFTDDESALLACYFHTEDSIYEVPNLIFESEHERGGHFAAAFEKPEALVTDLRAMFGKDGPDLGLSKEIVS
ncbi:hypothetical protein C0995_007343 [Termitomyces sp. Mi166|nr:hypothetical protein C0995_007343 [Termitomyces sp. Mi166\